MKRRWQRVSDGPGVFPFGLRKRPVDFDIAFTIRLDGKLHRLIDNPYRRPGFHLAEQRFDVISVHPHTARADAQTNAVWGVSSVDEIFTVTVGQTQRIAAQGIVRSGRDHRWQRHPFLQRARADAGPPSARRAAASEKG